MPILVDGNNLLHRLPAGERDRSHVRRLVLDRVRGERQRVTVVFDGPPPDGSPVEESLGAATVVYGNGSSADDVILRRLPDGAAARQWSVVTDDRALQRAARQRGAEIRSLAEWRSPRSRRPTARRPAAEAPLPSSEVEAWQRIFESRSDPEDEPPPVPRRRRRGR